MNRPTMQLQLTPSKAESSGPLLVKRAKHRLLTLIRILWSIWPLFRPTATPTSISQQDHIDHYI